MPALAPVRHQYEVLPYPHRDPARELEMLRQPTLCEIPRIQALAWGRPRDPATLRVLDAGCGTGDNTVFLAEQLRGTGAEIVALDFSGAALGIKRARLQARGLDGVRHIAASIEDAPSLGLGEFDLIVCTGVLHHLASPVEGLCALRAMLGADGLMAVMVYATYGREPVYLMQSLMQRLAPPSLSPEQRLRILKQTLQGLPQHSRTLRGLMDSPFSARRSPAATQARTTCCCTRRIGRTPSPRSMHGWRRRGRASSTGPCPGNTTRPRTSPVQTSPP